MSQPNMFATNFKESLTIPIFKYFGMLCFLTDQDIYFPLHSFFKIQMEGGKNLQDITSLYNVLYKNLSFKLQET